MPVRTIFRLLIFFENLDFFEKFLSPEALNLWVKPAEIFKKREKWVFEPTKVIFDTFGEKKFF